jgi:hypothetical protein
MACIISGCPNPAEHNLGVRLRRPDTSAIWAPNTEAFLCDHHAASGLLITVILEPTGTGEIETKVFSAGDSVSRTTPITHTP